MGTFLICCKKGRGSRALDGKPARARLGPNTTGGSVKTTTFLFISLALTALAAASPNGGPLGDFEAHGDIGTPKIAGYATYNGASQAYTLTAGGVNIWAKRDEFQY